MHVVYRKCMFCRASPSFRCPQTKDVEDDDVFKINPEFSSKLIKIKVGVPSTGRPFRAPPAHPYFCEPLHAIVRRCPWFLSGPRLWSPVRPPSLSPWRRTGDTRACLTGWAGLGDPGEKGPCMGALFLWVVGVGLGPPPVWVCVALPSPRIEAAVVRIMKTRRTLDHANLIAEVSKLLAPRFQASPQVCGAGGMVARQGPSCRAVRYGQTLSHKLAPCHCAFSR